MGWASGSGNKLCPHKKLPKKCGDCKKAAKAAKNRAKLDKSKAKADNSKMGQVRNAAKDMKTPWRADGSSRSGNRDAKGRNVNGIRYDDKGKRIWDND